jgi:hypothetical protein
MAVEAASMFSRVIQDHLELKERNAALEPRMPLGRYKTEDPFDNHPLFKSEEQARLEETLDGEDVVAHVHTVLAWPGEGTADNGAGVDTQTEGDTDSGLWTRSRDFDWGD